MTISVFMQGGPGGADGSRVCALRARASSPVWLANTAPGQAAIAPRCGPAEHPAGKVKKNAASQLTVTKLFVQTPLATYLLPRTPA